MNEYCVYILRCADASLYVGITNNVDRRVSEHGEGLDPGCYTFGRRPITLVYVARFSEVMDAIALEKRVKRWSRKKKEALIAGDEVMLRKSAACMNDSHHRNVDIDSITFHVRAVLKRVTLSGDEGGRLIIVSSLDSARDDTKTP